MISFTQLTYIVEFWGLGSAAGTCFDREGTEDQVQTEMVMEEGVASGVGWGSFNRKERR